MGVFTSLNNPDFGMPHFLRTTSDISTQVKIQLFEKQEYVGIANKPGGPTVWKPSGLSFLFVSTINTSVARAIMRIVCVSVL